MLFTNTILTVLLAFLGLGEALSHAQYHTNAISASSALMGWYNQTSGLFETTNWWNAANAISTLALLTKVNPQMEYVTGPIFSRTFSNAQSHHLFQEKASPDSYGPSNTSTPGQHEPRIRSFNSRNTYHRRPLRSYKRQQAVLSEWVMDPEGFLNSFYDDEGWWALGWAWVYDITGEERYINTAVEIFDDMLFTGYNATCGGIWWNKKRNYNSAISNELFLSVAATLANRVPSNREYYLSWAKKQWDWFSNSGLINSDWNVNDGLDLDDCSNNGGTIWSYNQGVILGGLAELALADPTNAEEYLTPAKHIAYAAQKKLTDARGVMHDKNEPDMGNDGNQFKGVFARNLLQLYDATGERWMRDFLLTNAQSVWRNGRNSTTDELGPVWSGPYYEATAATHSSALDVLVAAAAVA